MEAVRILLYELTELFYSYCFSIICYNVHNSLQINIIHCRPVLSTVLVSLHSVCCRVAENVTDGSQYFVLLMITDGVISDMVQTKEAVVNVRPFEVKN